MKLTDKIGEFFLMNAAVKAGLPKGSFGATTTTEETAVGVKQPTPAWKTALITAAATALLGAGGGAVASWWMTDEEPQQPAAPTQEQSGSLYQYLEDGGFHL